MAHWGGFIGANGVGWFRELPKHVDLTHDSQRSPTHPFCSSSGYQIPTRRRPAEAAESALALPDTPMDPSRMDHEWNTDGFPRSATPAVSGSILEEHVARWSLCFATIMLYGDGSFNLEPQ